MQYWRWVLSLVDRLLRLELWERWRVVERFERARAFFSAQLRLLETASGAHDPLVAIIRQEGRVTEGRYVVYFEVTLFGDNPVVLEEFGRVVSRETDPPPRFKRELMERIGTYRYFIELRQRFKTAEEARDYWLGQGATLYWAE